MERIQSSKLLRVLCYICIPIIVLIIGISAFHLTFISEFEEDEITKDFLQSKWFTSEYYYFITSKLSASKIGKEYIMVENEGKTVYYDQGEYSSFDEIKDVIDYIIIDKEKNVIYTNVKSNDYIKEIENMSQKNIYWNVKDGKIQTNLEQISEDNLKYNYSYLNGEQELIKRYEIYSSFNESKSELSNFNIKKQSYEFFMKNRNLPLYTLSISGIIFILIIIYLLWSIGYEKKQDSIELNTIDKVPYEILSVICLTIAFIFLAIIIDILNTINYLNLIIALFSYFLGYIFCAIWGISTIKRIKAKEFWKSFLIYKIINWIINKVKKLKKEIDNNIEGKKRVFWNYWGFVFLSIILICMIPTGIGLILLIIFWIWTFYKLLQCSRQEEEIKKALKNIYEGKKNISLNKEDFNKNLQDMTVYINDIAGGFYNAIEESLKSERLKTELITNVSHDIKTPLTSIINYVDLLKKEKIQNEKVKEYIDILEKKSQRLKKLTEDLVEASKVSSGNININLEIIDLKELVNQAIGEFEDKFKKSNLQVETNFFYDNLKIKADNRYMYRIIENIFSNISKYALEGSRVYIDMKEENNKIVISVKNISKEKLNISADELMQRFVRGDRSRYTEGSGLGLSIAQSLSELQGGTFDIVVDGDLFKVIMVWNVYK